MDASVEAITDMHANSVDDLPVHDLPLLEDAEDRSFQSLCEIATSAIDAGGTGGSLEPVVSPATAVPADGTCEGSYRLSPFALALISNRWIYFY